MIEDMVEDRILTVKEAAKRLGVIPVTVYRMCAQGRLAHTRVGAGRNIRILESGVEAVLASARAKSEARDRITGVRETLDRMERELRGP